jgi:RND superfamily putative drug exporter
MNLALPPGGVAVLTGNPVARRVALAVLSGRMRPDHGTIAVLDRILPSESAAVRARVAPLDHVPDPGVRRPPQLLLLDLDDVTPAAAAAVRKHAEAGAAVVVAARPGAERTLAEALPELTSIDLTPHEDREEALL